MERPERKQLRLKNYDYSRNGAYFITICIHNKQHLFGEIDTTGTELRVCDTAAAEMARKWLSEMENKYDNIKITKYIIMPSHIHFIIMISSHPSGTERKSIPQMIQWYKAMTTNEYINGVKSGLYPRFDKRLWQRNYYERVIRDDDEYQVKCRYIDENPENWESDDAIFF